MHKQNHNRWLFVGFLLLAGALHSFDPASEFYVSIIFCAEYLIYAGMILFWIQSVNRRLSSTWAKRYLMSAACLMLLFVIAQLTKFRIAVSPGLIRYCWYIYYIPILSIPTLFMMACFRLFAGSEQRKPHELCFLLPAVMLTLGILTNDLHKLAFIPGTVIAEMTGAPNTYTHGILYYMVYAWVGGTMAAGIILLLIACRKGDRWKKAVLPFLCLLIMPFVLMIYNFVPKDSIPITYEWVEIVIFGMLGVFEACIQNHLIPSNENYPGFFARMKFPALITDKEYHTVFQTQIPINTSREQLKASLNEPVYLTPDTRLLGMEIPAGYAFRTEDESTINRMNEELRNANEVLREKNEILKKEQALIIEQEAVKERSRLYQKAAEEVYSEQKKIAAILENAEPGTTSFREEIKRALVLTAYVKRKANFVLTEAERQTVSSREIVSAMEESSHYLSYCGMNVTIDVKTKRSFTCREAIEIYECFETAAEKLLEITKELYVCLKENELLMMTDVEDLSQKTEIIEQIKTPLHIQGSFAEKQLILRVKTGGEKI